MRLLPKFWHRLSAGGARQKQRLQKLGHIALLYVRSHGGGPRAIVKAGLKGLRILVLEGPTGLRRRLSKHSRPAGVPAPAPPPTGNSVTLNRIPELDIYGRVSNLERARSIMAGRPALASSRDRRSGLSVLILTKNRPEYIIPLVGQLLKEKASFREQGLELEILLGDTGSEDAEVLGFYKQVRRDVRIVSGMRYHFSSCNNELAARTRGDVLLFLNNDIVLPEKPGKLLWAYQRYLASPGSGAFGFAMYYPEGQTIQHMGVEFLDNPSFWGLPYHVRHRQAVAMKDIPQEADFPAVTGAALLVRRELFFEVNGFDPVYEQECQDTALCLDLLRLGYRNVCLCPGRMFHYENGTRRQGEENWKDRATFLRKYGSYIETILAEAKARRTGDDPSAAKGKAA